MHDTLTQVESYPQCREEDLLLANLLMKNQLAPEADVRYALAMQDALYQHGNRKIPRLVDLLKEDKVISEETIPLLLKALEGVKAVQAIQQANGNRLGALSNDFGQESESDPAHSKDTKRVSAAPENSEEQSRLAASPSNGTSRDREMTRIASQPFVPSNDAASKTTRMLPAARFSEVSYVPPVAPAPLRQKLLTEATEPPRGAAPSTEPSATKKETRTLKRPSEMVKAAESSAGGSDTSIEERRAHPRIQVKDGSVHFKKDSFLSTFNPLEKPSPIIDLSLGGLRILTSQPLTVGERLQILMHIPALDGELEAKVEVRSCHTVEGQSRPFLLGRILHSPACFAVRLKFIYLSESVQKQLERLIHDPALLSRGKFRRYS